MNDMNRFAALWVVLLALGGVAACAIHLETRPAPPPATVAKPGARRLLMQSMTSPARWEALQVIGSGPRDFVRTELDASGAAHYQQEGGFVVVTAESYTRELRRISDAIRAAEAPTLPFGSRLSAAAVARMNQRAGREPVIVLVGRD
jgi:hypothetical protein